MVIMELLGLPEADRYDGPIELGISRFTTEEITVGDVTIPGGGEVVLLAIGAADRDPDRFADPDLLQTRRTETAHLGFGHGIHYCLGAPLARMEAGIALRVLLDRCVELSLAVDPNQIVWQVNPRLRGPAALPVRFTPNA
jgi:cytochrome P450